MTPSPAHSCSSGLAWKPQAELVCRDSWGCGGAVPTLKAQLLLKGPENGAVRDVVEMKRLVAQRA